jgi:hypothetical protein
VCGLDLTRRVFVASLGALLNPLAIELELGSASETEVVIGLLRSSGIPAVHPGRYAQQQILVPFKFVAEANRLIADAGDVAPNPAPLQSNQRTSQPKSVGFSLVVLIVIGLWLGWFR